MVTHLDDRGPVWVIWLLIAFGAVQPVVWWLAGDFAQRPIIFLPMLAGWAALLVLAALSTRQIGWLSRTLTRETRAHKATLNEVEQLQTQTAMLEIIATSADVPLAFRALAGRIARLVPCDRVGLALLTDDGQEFQTFTARVDETERRARPRPEIVFRVDRTILGTVVRSREPLIVDDIERAAPDYVDANVLASARFRSALVMPLVSKERAVGTLNVVSRQPQAFSRADIEALRSISEILAVAWVAQQLHTAVGKYRTMETMSELTLSIAAEINSALQTIVGHCDLLQRAHQDPALLRDLETIVQQAGRVSELLHRMRAAASERLKEMEARISDGRSAMGQV
ncbi:MAG TPA: GAF domain-containing protein [Vicinamibacterales bacterium]|nr:GAF domain-containing protein [Vicinamibacterales bacterium]